MVEKTCPLRGGQPCNEDCAWYCGVYMGCSVESMALTLQNLARLLQERM